MCHSRASGNPYSRGLRVWPDGSPLSRGRLERLGDGMKADVVRKPNTFRIDGREVDIRAGETIFRAARRLGIKLPHLCYLPKPGYRPDGNCRVCMVEIEGERVLAESCIRTPTPDMKVNTRPDRAHTARPMVSALFLTDPPPTPLPPDPHSSSYPPT